MSAVIFPNAPVLKYPGSPPRDKGRQAFSYWENRNGSYVPTCLLVKAVSTQIIKEGKIFHRVAVSLVTYTNGKGQTITRKSPTYLREPTDTLISKLPAEIDASLAKKLKPAYRDHFETRLQFLWRQFLLVFGGGFEFSESNTSTRAEGVVGKGITGYQAAHSSTLPRLPHKVGNKELIFAGNTPLGDGDSTVLLPTEANKVDTSIDLHAKKLKVDALRSTALTLLSAVSKAKNPMTPPQAFQKFLKAAALVTKAHYQQSEKGSIQETVALQYRIVVKRYRKMLKTPTFFNRFCIVKGTLDADGYIALRNQLHGLVSAQATIPTPAPQSPLNHNGKWIVNGKTYTIEVAQDKKKAKEYALTCLASHKVKEAIDCYKKQNKERTEQDLIQLNTGGGFAKLKKKISKEMTVVIESCLAATKKTSIQQLHMIVQWVLVSS